MSFIPQLPIDPTAVFGSLRVTLQNHIHAGERIIDVGLDTISDLSHQSAVMIDAFALSQIELGQSLFAARTCRDVWSSLADHGHRISTHYFNYIDEWFNCRHRALDRLQMKDAPLDG